MSQKDNDDAGICILSFDGGGPGTYSQLLIVKEYMTRLAFDLGTDVDELLPANYFDLMGGVGFGGLVAFMLGHLRMPVDAAINALHAIVSSVFSTESTGESSPEKKMLNLREALEDMIQGCGLLPDQKMNDIGHPAGKCKVALYAATSANISHPQTFRNYPSRRSKLNPTIVDALCATMATPPHFSAVKIGAPMRQQSFLGGALGANNPTRELLNEASDVFGKEKRVAQIITLGSGRPHAISLNNSTPGQGIDQVLASISADCETVARDLSMRLSGINAYLRLNVDRGMENLTFCDWTDIGSIESHTTAYVETVVVSKAIDTSLRTLQERIGSATLSQINNSRQTGLRNAAKSPPPVTPHFVARDRANETMHHHLIKLPSTTQKIFVITGMGGCGKTQLVSYFLQENRSLYTHIVYVDASSTNSIKADLQSWIRSVGEGHDKDVWEDSLDFLRHESREGLWILVLDNADDPKIDVLPFIPLGYHGSVIITSRNRNLGNLATTFHLELGEMGRDEALSALLHSARRQLPLESQELEDAYCLLEILGYLPLAVVQGGAYCRQLTSSNENPFTFSQYLSLFSKNRSKLLTKAEPSSLDRYQRGVYATLELSYDVISDAIKSFLLLLSAFNCSSIPLVMLATAAQQQFVDPEHWMVRPDGHNSVISNLTALFLIDGEWRELELQEMIQTLSSFSLLSTTSTSGNLFLRMHPLVQAWTMDTMLYSESQKQISRAMARQILTSCSIRESSFLNQYLLPHVLHMLGFEDNLHPNDQMALAMVLGDQGYYQHAEYLYRDALNTLENELGDEHPETLLVLVYLAGVCRDHGQWSEAEALATRALDVRRRTLGDDHPDTIASESQVAWIYSEQGRWKESESLESAVLNKRTRILGPDHPDTLWAATNLAVSYRFQGRWKDALRLTEEVFAKRDAILGKDHIDTIKAAANLATSLRTLGRWNEAKEFEIGILESRKRLLGEDHPSTITAQANLAQTYRQLGRWALCQPLAEDVLKRRIRIFGPNHPLTNLALGNVADLYRLQGRWKEAEEMELTVWDWRKRRFGEDHPETINAACFLAITYSKQQRWKEAEELCLKVLEHRRMVQGEQDPDTIWALADLANVYRELGRAEEAETLELRVLEFRQDTIGMEHPDTLWAATNLAQTYNSLGKWDQAERLLLSVESIARTFEPEHPDFAFVLTELSNTYRGQGKAEKAAAFLSEAVDLSLKVTGERHPDTQLRIRNITGLYEALGNLEGVGKMESLLLPS